MAVQVYEKINLTNLDSMDLALKSNEQLNQAIEEKIRSYNSINVSVTMKNLGGVGKILQVAYAGSKGFTCSESIIEILSKYQRMIKNSFIATASFTDASLSALKCHKLALMMAEKNKLDTALKMLEKCSLIANKMANESEKLTNEADTLCQLCEKALLTAQKDENLSTDEKNKISKMIYDSNSKEAELKQITTDLYKQISEYNEKIAEIAKQSNKERQKEFALKLISTMIIF